MRCRWMGCSRTQACRQRCLACRRISCSLPSLQPKQAQQQQRLAMKLRWLARLLHSLSRQAAPHLWLQKVQRLRQQYLPSLVARKSPPWCRVQLRACQKQRMHRSQMMRAEPQQPGITQWPASCRTAAAAAQARSRQQPRMQRRSGLLQRCRARTCNRAPLQKRPQLQEGRQRQRQGREASRNHCQARQRTSAQLPAAGVWRPRKKRR